MNVMIVVEPLGKLTSDTACENSYWRKTVSLMSVGNPSPVVFLLLCTREYITERKPTSAVTVGKL